MGYSPRGHKESDTTEQLHLLSLFFQASDHTNIFTLYNLVRQLFDLLSHVFEGKGKRSLNGFLLTAPLAVY